MSVEENLRDLKWISYNPYCGIVWQLPLELETKESLVGLLTKSGYTLPTVALGERLILHYICNDKIVDIVFTDRTADYEEDNIYERPNDDEVLNAIRNDYSYARLFTGNVIQW